MQSKAPSSAKNVAARRSSYGVSSSRPSSEMRRKFSGSHRVNQSDNHVNVAIRCRPLSEKEIRDGHKSIVDFEDGNKIVIHNTSESPSDQLGTNSGERHNYSQVFEFDAVFDCQSTQEDVYNQSCRPIVDSVLEGYNGTIFAYGQTGAGKTYTMEGATSRLRSKRSSSKLPVETKRPTTAGKSSRRSSDAKIDDKTTDERSPIKESADSAGIIPRAFEQIFEHIAKNPSIQFLIRASYLEIYQEEIHDLLKKDKSVKLELHEKSGVGVYVKDLTSFACKSIGEIERVMRVGNQNRHVGATDMNEYSSRSHAIFMITIEQQQMAPPLIEDPTIDNSGKPTAKQANNSSGNHQAANRVIKVGKLNLVDLAGSERQRKTNSSGQRQKESIKINLSLSALGNVINSLMKLHTSQQQSNNQQSDTISRSRSSKSANVVGNNIGNGNSFTPYRDSKLTRLLQDSLGGNAKTLMIANIGPASYNYDETINTLNYASRAKCIRNKPKLNEDPKDALLRELQREIDHLRSKLSAVTASGSSKLTSAKDQSVASESATVSNSSKRKVEQELLELRQKLSSLEGKLLNGVKLSGQSAEQILQQRLDQKLLQGLTQTQELELEKRRLELASQVSREQEIREELERREEAELLAKKSFTSIQQEVDSKRQLIRQVLLKIKSLRDQTERVQETYRLELEELDQLQYVLQKELKLKCLIMDNFIPNTHVDQLLPRIMYDERRNSCSVIPIECPLDYCLNYNYSQANENGQSNPSSLDRYENYWQPTDGISVRPRSEFERLGETIYPGNIRFKCENLIESKLERPKVNPIKKLESGQAKINTQPPERSNIQELIDAALNQRESDIVI